MPGFAPAVDALERMYARSGKHAEYAALRRGRAVGAPPAARAERLFETLVAEREALDDLPGAAAGGAAPGRAQPDDVRARVRLLELDRAAQKLAEAADDLAELAQLLARGAAHRGAARARRSARAAARRLARRGGRVQRGADAQAGRSARHRRVRAAVAAARQGVGPARGAVAAGVGRSGGGAAARGAGVAVARAHHHRAAQARRDPRARARQLGGRGAGLSRSARARARPRGGAARPAARLRGDSATMPKRADALAEEVEGLKESARGEALLAARRALRGHAQAARSRRRRLRPRARARHQSARGARPPAHGGARARAGGAGGGDRAPRAAGLWRRRRRGGARGPDRRARRSGAQGRRRRGGAGAHRRGARARSAGAPAVAGARAAVGARRRGGGARRRARGAGAALGRSGAAGGAAAARGSAGAVVGLARDAHRGGGAATAAPGADADAVGHRRRWWRCARWSPIPTRSARAPSWPRARRSSSGTSSTASRWKRRGASARRRRRWRARSSSIRIISARSSWRAGWRAPAATTRRYAAATVRLAAEVLEGERAAGFYREAAETFERAGAQREAAGAWRAVLDRTPLDGAAANRARELLGRALRRGRGAGRCSSSCSRIDSTTCASVDDRVRLYLERATLLHDGGDRDGAERDLRAVLDLDPGEPEALRRLAELVAAKPERPPTRRSSSSAATSRTRTIARCAGPRCTSWPSCYEHAGKLDDAVARLEEAITLAPKPGRRARRAREAGAAVGAAATVAARGRGAAPAVGPRRCRARARRRRDPHRDDLSRGLLRSARRRRGAVARAAHRSAVDGGAGEADAAGRRRPRAAASSSRRSWSARSTPRARRSPPGRSTRAPYQQLTRLWGWRGDDDCRLIAAQAEALAVGRAPPGREHAVEPTKELSTQSWERIWPETARSVALEVWRAAGEATAALYGPSLESLGVGKRERVNAKGTPLAWIPVDKIARSLCGCALRLRALRRAASPTSAWRRATRWSAATHSPTSCRRRCASAWRGGSRSCASTSGRSTRIEDDELALFFAACARVAELPTPPALTSAAAGAGRGARQDARQGAGAQGSQGAAGDRRAHGDAAAARRVAPGGARGRGSRGAGGRRRSGGRVHRAVADAGARIGWRSRWRSFAVSDDFRVLRRDMGLKG